MEAEVSRHSDIPIPIHGVSAGPSRWNGRQSIWQQPIGRHVEFGDPLQTRAGCEVNNLDPALGASRKRASIRRTRGSIE